MSNHISSSHLKNIQEELAILQEQKGKLIERFAFLHEENNDWRENSPRDAVEQEIYFVESKIKTIMETLQNIQIVDHMYFCKIENISKNLFLDIYLVNECEADPLSYKFAKTSELGAIITNTTIGNPFKYNNDEYLLHHLESIHSQILGE